MRMGERHPSPGPMTVRLTLVVRDWGDPTGALGTEQTLTMDVPEGSTYDWRPYGVDVVHVQVSA